jgi:HSP20 family molecular chaperone IbpA
MFTKNANVGDVPSIAKRRPMIERWLEPSEATFISPIERWADNNYAPNELGYLFTQKSELSEIIAPLHGFSPQDIHVDISRGQVIILLSDHWMAYPKRQEYYCEVPLPSDVTYRNAYLEVGSKHLTIHLQRKQSVFHRAVSAACRVKLGWQAS